jgi:hypothetical protein
VSSSRWGFLSGPVRHPPKPDESVPNARLLRAYFGKWQVGGHVSCSGPRGGVVVWELLGPEMVLRGRVCVEWRARQLE